jgi:hypothetical protein
MMSPLTSILDAPQAGAEALARRTAFAGLMLCTLAFWMLQHPYEGLTHDSTLYSFAALARLHPESLGHDIFLGAGSQDRYTLFSPAAAELIRLLGLEPAAALITFFSQLAFFVAGWLLARRLMSPALAVLAAGLLVTLPGIYGSQHLFSYSEVFMTPRVPAEAFVLLALTAAIAERFIPALLCLLAAALLHPLMAAPGIVLLFVRFVALPRPRLALTLAATASLALVAVAYLFPIGPVARFDAAWFDLLHSRLQYLFPSLWPREDWAHASVPLATLLVGTLTASDQPTQRSLFVSALVTGAAGLGLALVGSDLLHIELVAQLQAWRWLWLANALAVLLIPVITANCWRAGIPTRASAVLLAAAWVCVDERFAWVLALLAIAAALAAGRLQDPRHSRLLLLGAWGVLTLCSLIFVGAILSVIRKLGSIAPDTTLYDSSFLLAVRQYRPWASGGILTAGVLAVGWYGAIRRMDRIAAAALLAAGVVLCTMFAPLAWNAWTRTRAFPERLHATFAPWREAIPPTAEVLWPDFPTGTWFLLERKSYWSVKQMAGAVFSRDRTMELVRREQVLHQAPSTLEPQQELIDTCTRNPGLGFVVTARDLGPTRFDPAILDPERPEGHLRLYECAQYQTGIHP